MQTLNLNATNLVVKLNVDDYKIIVKQPQFPVHITGATFYYFHGSGATSVSAITTGNIVNVYIYSPTGQSATWGNIVGAISGQTDLWNILSGMTIDIQSAQACCSGLTIVVNDLITFVSGYTGTTNLHLQTIDGQILALSGATSGGTIYNGQTPAAITLGGIAAGTVLTGKTFTDLFEELLVPVLYPSFVNPSNTFTIGASAYYEVDDIQTINFSAGFSRGSISPAYGTNGFRSGLPNNYIYTGAGLPSPVPSTSLTDSQSVIGYTMLQGNQSWTGAVAFDVGQQPKDSKGNNYNAPYPAGTTGAITRTIEGVYPLYATTVAIATLTKQTLVSMLSANNIVFSMLAETGGNKQAFEIPNTWLASRPLVGVQTYNTVSASWEYQGGTAATSKTYWTTSAVTETIQGNVINYTKYTYNGVDRSAVQIKLIF